MSSSFSVVDQLSGPGTRTGWDSEPFVFCLAPSSEVLELELVGNCVDASHLLSSFSSRLETSDLLELKMVGNCVDASHLMSSSSSVVDRPSGPGTGWESEPFVFCLASSSEVLELVGNCIDGSHLLSSSSSVVDRPSGPGTRTGWDSEPIVQYFIFSDVAPCQTDQQHHQRQEERKHGLLKDQGAADCDVTACQDDHHVLPPVLLECLVTFLLAVVMKIDFPTTGNI